jgi:hypothetical protein
MRPSAEPSQGRVLRVYYGATPIFLLLDYRLGLNIRIAGLEGYPVLKGGYYLVVMACFALMLLRPARSVAIGIVESLATLVTLIFGIALRSLLVSEQTLESGTNAPRLAEILNFLISGSVAWYAWQSGMRRVFDARRR